MVAFFFLWKSHQGFPDLRISTAFASLFFLDIWANILKKTQVMSGDFLTDGLLGERKGILINSPRNSVLRGAHELGNFPVWGLQPSSPLYPGLFL